jgi:hypothetical protein
VSSFIREAIGSLKAIALVCRGQGGIGKTTVLDLWQQQGKRQHAQQLLTEVYSWFTEGIETPDLQEAKMWLEAL